MSHSKRYCIFILLALHGLTRAHPAITVIGSDGVVPGTASSDVPVGSYIRSDAPGDSKPNRFLLVGELNANRGSVRGVLSFDLGAIPPGATINSVTLSLYQDRAPAGSGAFRAVDIELFSMSEAVVPGATWNNSSSRFDTLLASISGDAGVVVLNQAFAFSSPALTQFTQDSLIGGTLDLGLKAPALEALTNLPASEYFVFDGPDATGHSGSTDSIGPSLRIDYDIANGNETHPEGGIIINEIHCNPDLSYELVEFIELYNSKDEAIDLSGWMLSKGIDFTFPDGTTIGSGEYIVITEDASLRTATPTNNVAAKYGADLASIYGPFIGGLNNDGERIELHDATGQKIDEVDYGHGFPWPTVGDGPSGDGSGHSMQLVHADLDNDLGGSWRNALPTPADANVWVITDNLPPQIRQVQHLPETPTSTNTVTVSAKISDTNTVTSVDLLYQIVTPGNYVRINDAAYTNWITLPMNDAGTVGDLVAGDSIFSAQLPASTRAHRNLIRYRIRATDGASKSVTVPYPDDPQPNFALFIYDGLPAWSGGNNGEAATTFSSDVMGSMRPYHLIARPIDVTNCQYNASFENTRFNGTLVYDGEVYDHIEFKVRGQGSTYLSGKNKWKLFFNRGHEFEARDDYGKKYAEPWRVMSLSACATPYNANHRGSSGIDEALGFRLFNLAGVPAPRTHYFQLRVIDDAVEANPSSQYQGDLWGLYMATEFPDGRFLKEHDLPDGNTYKMEGSGDKKHQGATQSVDSSDLNSFRSAYNAGQNAAWWQANLDMESYLAFRSVNQIINNLDMSDTRNFYWHHNATTDRWTPIPWDIDNAYLHANSEHVSIGAIACLDHPSIKLAYDNDVRELQDLLFTREQTSALIDELASIIEPPGLPQSMVNVDQFMWNYHPRTRTTSVFPHIGGFFRNPATRTSSGGSWSYTRTLASSDFEGMKHFFKDFVAPRAGSVTTHNSTWQYWNGWELHDSRFTDSGIPDTPTVQYTGVAGFPANELHFETSAFIDAGGTFGAMKWRIAEIAAHTPPVVGFGGTISAPAKRGKYEIDAIWESAEITAFNSAIQIPAINISSGTTYRVRCKMMNNSGHWSHWSAPVEFVAGAADVTFWRDNLVISELMYHPAETTRAEREAGFTTSDFDYIELQNIGTNILDLRELRFTKGVDFDFIDGSITNLAPGAYVLVVSDPAALAFRYGPGLPIAGSFAPDKLSNSGELVKLSFALGTAVHEFTYFDDAPWPGAADGYGPSLELINPTNRPDHSLAINWQASAGNGSPGGTNMGSVFTGTTEADADNDGLAALLEFALGTSDTVTNTASDLYTYAAEEFDGDNYATFTYQRNLAARDIGIIVEISKDLLAWETAPERLLEREIPSGSGTSLITWRSREPLDGVCYFRLRIVQF